MAGREQAEADEPTILTKMSNKTLGCNPGECVVRGGDVSIARYIGVARGIKKTTGNDGEDTYALVGNFEGINLQNGRRFVSGILYMPGGIQELVLGPLDDLIAGTADVPADPNGQIMFGYDIAAYPAANKSGYSYKAIDLASAHKADPLAALKAKLADKLALLPAK